MSATAQSLSNPMEPTETAPVTSSTGEMNPATQGAKPALSMLKSARPRPLNRPKPRLTMVQTEATPVSAPAVTSAPETDPNTLLQKWALSALDNSRACAFLCDSSLEIVYANQRSYEMLEFMEPNLHRYSDEWKSFHAAHVVGTNLDFLFTDEPQEIKRVSDPRFHPYRKQIKTGPCVCDVQVTSITDDAGKLVGYAVSWERITEQVAKEKFQQQLMIALENSSTAVMVTDADLKMIYLNTKLSQSLKSWEPELKQKYGASFDVNALLGRCIDDLHKDPSHQRRMLANGSLFPLHTRIELGSRKIDIIVNQLKNPSGESIGYTTEWHDVTDRLLEEADYKANVQTIADRMEFIRGACSTDLATAMEALANGDLTVEITPRTPLLDIPAQPDLALMAETFNGLRNQTVKAVESYNRAKDSLSLLLAKTRNAADNIYQGSSEVATGTDDLAQRTEEQASSLEETAASMEQMTSTVKQNADNSRTANQLATQAREVAERGGAVVGTAVTSMEEINKASKRIADIISVIDEIAFQTNLLALNAAVEAARVGEQGRGFAVVAAEVRNLAGRSATAAKEIKALVQDSVQKVQEGSNLVNQSGHTLEEIVNSVKKVADIIAEISAASQEQAAGIEQVNKAVIQMDQITQQNAALVEETAAASQSMSQQSTELRSLVSQFQLDDSYLTESTYASSPAPSRPKTQVAPRAARSAAPTASKSFSKSSADDDFEEF